MADLSTLSDDQLSVYKDLLSKKQGAVSTSVPGMEKLGGTPPEVKPPNVVKEQTVGDFAGNVGKQALKNIPKGLNELYGQGFGPQQGSQYNPQVDHDQSKYTPGPSFGNLIQSTEDSITDTGKQVAHLFANPEQDPLAAMATGRGIVEAVPQRLKDSIKVAAGPITKGALKAGTGAGAMLAAKSLGLPGEIGTGYAVGPLIRGGVTDIINGIKTGADRLIHGEVAPPVEPPKASPPPKGPSIGQLTTSAKKGVITPEQFNDSVDKMTDISQEAKDLHKANLQRDLNPPAKTTPGEPEKELSLGHLQQLVKMGRMDLEEYNGRLARAGYNEVDRGHLTELLKQQMEDEEAAEAEAEKKKTDKTSKDKVGAPAKKEPSPVKPPSEAGKLINRPGEIPANPDWGKIGGQLADALSGSGPKDTINAELNYLFPKGVEDIGPVETPKETNPFLEQGAPFKPEITEQQIEESQSDARVAKENKLAKHFNDNKVDLSQIPRTSEYLRAIGKEAGLKREPSLRTLENAIKKAQDLRK